MSKNFDRGVDANHFQGAARVHGRADEVGSLADVTRELLRGDARRRLVAANLADLTDNSGGTAPVAYKQLDSAPLPDNDLTGLTTGVTAASLNAAADSVMNALATLLERCNDGVFAVVGMGTASEGPGTPGSGTIAAIDDTAVANAGNTTAATTASARAVQRDLLHAQRMVMHAIDDAREAVGLARKVPTGPGRWDKTGNLTFTSEGESSPAVNSLSRSSGSWVADGFMPGDVVGFGGSDANGGVEVAIESMTDTVLTFPSGTNVSVDVITAATEGRTFEVVTARRDPHGLGKLSGFDGQSGADWTLSFETGGAAISDAVNGSDATSAVLLADWDAFVDELSDNVALMADAIDDVTDVADSPLNRYAD